MPIPVSVHAQRYRRLPAASSLRTLPVLRRRRRHLLLGASGSVQPVMAPSIAGSTSHCLEDHGGSSDNANRDAFGCGRPSGPIIGGAIGGSLNTAWTDAMDGAATGLTRIPAISAAVRWRSGIAFIGKSERWLHREETQEQIILCKKEMLLHHTGPRAKPHCQSKAFIRIDFANINKIVNSMCSRSMARTFC